MPFTPLYLGAQLDSSDCVTVRTEVRESKRSSRLSRRKKMEDANTTKPVSTRQSSSRVVSRGLVKSRSMDEADYLNCVCNQLPSSTAIEHLRPRRSKSVRYLKPVDQNALLADISKIICMGEDELSPCSSHSISSDSSDELPPNSCLSLGRQKATPNSPNVDKIRQYGEITLVRRVQNFPSPVSALLAQEKQEIHEAFASRSRRVRFTENDNLKESNQITVPMSEDEIKNAFWTREDIANMRRTAERLAENFAGKDNKRIATCLNVLFENCCASKHDACSSTIESGFQYLYSCEEDEEQTSTRRAYTRCRSTTDGSLRGLEELISPEGFDRRTKFVQSILRKQRNLQRRRFRRKNTSEKQGISSEKSVEAMLAKASAKASSPARRFARLLGKVDEALAKTDMKRLNEPKQIRRATID